MNNELETEELCDLELESISKMNSNLKTEIL